MYAAVDSREVREQAGMSHNRHQASLIPPGQFPLAGWEQSPGAEEELSTGWGWTPQPQHPLWLCPLVPGGLSASQPWFWLGHGPKSGEMPKTSPLLRCTASVVSLLPPSATRVIVTCIPAAPWHPHRAPTPPRLQLGPSPLLSASASWSEIPALPPQLQPGGLVLHPAVTRCPPCAPPVGRAYPILDKVPGLP